jgi:N-acetyl-anhydromuramyl-L-alanine amidase AmpD
MRKINEIIVHCSATPEGRDVTAEEIRRWHLDKGWKDIGYHYVIERSGKIRQGRHIDLMGFHTTGKNQMSIGVCYVGGLDSDMKAKDTRTGDQKDSFHRLLYALCIVFPTITRISGHRDYSKKDCPCFNARVEYSCLVQDR